MISVELNFDMKFHNLHFLFLYFDRISIFFFTIDILIKFSLSFYEDGNSVKTRLKIIKHYLKSDFLFDVLSLMALICTDSDMCFPLKFFPGLFVLQYRNINKIYNDIEQFLRFDELGDLFEMALVVFKTICVTHIFACFWHSIAYYQIQANPAVPTWLGSLQMINSQSEWHEKYLLSIYWALTTLVTVGYGDITPKNLYETAFCTFTLLCGTLVFGYMVNCVGFILLKKQNRIKELKYKEILFVYYFFFFKVNIYFFNIFLLISIFFISLIEILTKYCF